MTRRRVSALRRQMEAAARQRGHEAPETETNHDLSRWLWAHPAEPQSISLADLSEAPKRRGRR